MSDWLSEVEASKKREEETRQRQNEEFFSELTERANRTNEIYERHKHQIEHAYDRIEAYVKRAAEMGFPVKVKRSSFCIRIENSNRSWKSELFTSLAVAEYGFEVRFCNDNASVSSTTRIRFDGISDSSISSWVRWVATEQGLTFPKTTGCTALALTLVIAFLVAVIAHFSTT